MPTSVGVAIADAPSPARHRRSSIRAARRSSIRSPPIRSSPCSRAWSSGAPRPRARAGPLGRRQDRHDQRISLGLVRRLHHRHRRRRLYRLRRQPLAGFRRRRGRRRRAGVHRLHGGRAEGAAGSAVRAPRDAMFRSVNGIEEAFRPGTERRREDQRRPRTARLPRSARRTTTRSSAASRGCGWRHCRPQPPPSAPPPPRQEPARDWTGCLGSRSEARVSRAGNLPPIARDAIDPDPRPRSMSARHLSIAGFDMRPDVEAMKADIEQSVALLRRRL